MPASRRGWLATSTSSSCQLTSSSWPKICRGSRGSGRAVSSYAHRHGVRCLSVASVSDLAYTSNWGWSHQPGPSYHMTLARVESLPGGTLSSSTGTSYCREPRRRSAVVPHDDPLAALREEPPVWTQRKENVGDQGARNRRG